MIDWIPCSEIQDLLTDGPQVADSGLQKASQKNQAHVETSRKTLTQGHLNASQKVLITDEPLAKDVRTSTDCDIDGAETENFFDFRIVTAPCGHNNGRTYNMRCATAEECQKWVEQIKHARKTILSERPSLLSRMQHAARTLLDSYLFQRFIMISILVCFITSMLSSEFLGPPKTTEGDGEEDGGGREVDPTARLAFNIIDDIFTGIFVLELLLSFAAYWFFPFFRSAWRVFDLIAVTGSLVSAIEADVPGNGIYSDIFDCGRVLFGINPYESLLSSH